LRRTSVTSLSVFAVVLGSVGTAHAQSATGFAVDKFEPSERGSDWFTTESLDLRGSGRPALGVITDYQLRPLATYKSNGDANRSIVRNMLTFHAGGAINLFDRVRLAVSLPLVAFVDGKADRFQGRLYPSPGSEQSVGDLRFAADLRLAGSYGDPITLAIGVQAWAPTGDRAAYSGDGEWRVQPHAAVAGDIGSFTYGARMGATVRERNDAFAGSDLGSELAFAASAGVRVADKRLVVGPEVFGTTVFDDAFSKRSTPLEGILGLHYAFAGGFRLGAGVGTGLTRGYGSPEFRGLLGLEWFPEIAPEHAAPPPEAPTDRDNDGVLDSVDACPDVPGVASEDPKTNGCPPDSDGDGVYDSVDACPDVPGVATNDPKTNGCPADTDRDGVLDSVDACPDVPGIKTSDPKTNGCPDLDRDKDTIPNDVDACPDEPGPADPDPKRNGCPKAFVQAGQIKILDQVKFKTGSAEIQGKESDEVLSAVLKVLTDHAEIKKVRVEGHTDSTGNADMNKKLSAARAASVVKWLTSHGIDKARLSSEGFGPDKPIAENSTPEGRQANRRVEFHID
jgi:outer membrane protein OmpA-like peptidoglycan-associated protein